jgi:hypothetical protein
MAVQNNDKASEFQGEDEPLPAGYTEALNDCTALAANLLSKALYGEDINRCWDCSAWVGRCLKGKILRIARDEACSEFSPRKKKGDSNARDQ